jgi:hypothetical protein
VTGSKQRIQPRTRSKGGTQEREHLWEAEEHARRTYVIFSERRSWNMESEPPVAYEEGRNRHCGGAGPLRNGRRRAIRVRRAGCGGAPATPGVIVPTGEKVRVRMRESEKANLWMIVIRLDLLAT